MFATVDIVAYTGTIILILATQLPKRWHLHTARIIGTFLWLIYGILIMNLPVITVEAVTIISEIIAFKRFKEKN